MNVRGFLQALGFLTVLPLPQRARTGFTPAAAAYFPLAGLLVGVLVASCDAVLGGFPAAVRSILVVGAWLGITGALHLDGFIDACDALAPGLTRERALVALRDPRAGAMGTAGAVVLLSTKWAALTALAAHRFAWIVFAAVVARAAVAWLLVVVPTSATPEGLGASMARGVAPRHAVLPGIVVAGCLSFVAWAPWVTALAAALAGAALVSVALHRRVGGVTGDAFGAVVELAETSTLLVAVAGAWR